jgi:hypothetical protein
MNYYQLTTFWCLDNKTLDSQSRWKYKKRQQSIANDYDDVDDGNDDDNVNGSGNDAIIMMMMIMIIQFNSIIIIIIIIIIIHAVDINSIRK